MSRPGAQHAPTTACATAGAATVAIGTVSRALRVEVLGSAAWAWSGRARSDTCDTVAISSAPSSGDGPQALRVVPRKALITLDGMHSHASSTWGPPLGRSVSSWSTRGHRPPAPPRGEGPLPVRERPSTDGRRARLSRRRTRTASCPAISSRPTVQARAPGVRMFVKVLDLAPKLTSRDGSEAALAPPAPRHPRLPQTFPEKMLAPATSTSARLGPRRGAVRSAHGRTPYIFQRLRGLRQGADPAPASLIAFVRTCAPPLVASSSAVSRRSAAAATTASALGSICGACRTR